jgi:hypothetical protein
MESARDLFGAFRYIPSKKRQSERGILLEYFASKLGWQIGRVVGKLGHLKDIQDLYYIKSICDQYEREGKEWSKAFNGSLKPRKLSPPTLL